ncbi:hypothetical protein [Desulfonema ishimotonii]|nr:hypothetical protein [Desulfonema ishimotonii]
MKKLLIGTILTLCVLLAETAFAEMSGDVDGNNKRFGGHLT